MNLGTSSVRPASFSYRPIERFELSDLEAVRLLLRGGSVIDWHRLNFESDEAILEFIRVQEFDLEDPADNARIAVIKADAINYLRRNFDFPVPKPVAEASLPDLLRLASSKGHRQLCACTILKVMHIIHHLEARELLSMLPISTQDVFLWVERKVYRIVGAMMASGLPIQEFVGGRKHKDSLYTKLLSKPETLAAQIYDKQRFRIVTRTSEGMLTVLQCLMTNMFPFNYAIPVQSTNTLLPLDKIIEAHPNLHALYPRMQSAPEAEERHAAIDNRFSANNYRTVNFVVDMPVRLSEEQVLKAPKDARLLGRVIFAQVEFQMYDRHTEHLNELGEASHEKYKQRQKKAVVLRLKLGVPSEQRVDSEKDSEANTEDK